MRLRVCWPLRAKQTLLLRCIFLSSLDVDGTAAIVEFPGVLYRAGAEQKIRQYLIDNNYVDSVIQLPHDLFFGTGISTCVVVLKKSKSDNRVLFIDAINEFVRIGNKNQLLPEHRQKILSAFGERLEIPHFARLVNNTEITENSYILSVSSYVEQAEERASIDITQHNAELARIVKRQGIVRSQIDAIVADLEGESH